MENKEYWPHDIVLILSKITNITEITNEHILFTGIAKNSSLIILQIEKISRVRSRYNLVVPPLLATCVLHKVILLFFFFILFIYTDNYSSNM